MIVVRYEGMRLEYPTARYLVEAKHGYDLWTDKDKKHWVASIPAGAILENGLKKDWPVFTQQGDLFE